jgi:hypothetical protein
MNIEILFRDGTKLKLVGYEVASETNTQVTYLKKETGEVVIAFYANVSYIYATPQPT